MNCVNKLLRLKSKINLTFSDIFNLHLSHVHEFLINKFIKKLIKIKDSYFIGNFNSADYYGIGFKEEQCYKQGIEHEK